MSRRRPASFGPLVARSHALVTGGSSGIGLEIARELHRLGGTVHLVARDGARLEEAQEDLLTAAGPDRSGAHSETRSGVNSHADSGGPPGAPSHAPSGTVRIHRCDVSSPEAVDALFAGLAAAGELPSVVVNSAGKTIPAYFHEHSVEDFRVLMEVNFFGTLHVLMKCVPEMRERGEGYILNVSSVAGLLGVYGMTAYSSAKFAVRGLTEALRSELREHGVVTSLLCPPDTETPMLREEVPLRPPETEALSPSDQAISPKEVAQVAVKGLARGKAVIVPGLSGKLPVLAQRIAPGMLEWATDRIVRGSRSR